MAVERIPYFAEQIVEFLQSVEQIILVGAKPPVSFFAYPGKPSWCAAGRLPHSLSRPARMRTARQRSKPWPKRSARREADPNAPGWKSPSFANGKLNAYSAGQAIGHFLPENAIISDEGATSGIGAAVYTMTAAPHDHLALTGGSIGLGVPLATGAAVACPDRKVVCLQGDGGGMYTLQALWTQAREKLDVTTVIFANHSYAILNIELMRVGAENPGPKALSLFDLRNPELDWVMLATGMGVEATRATTAEEFDGQFESAMKGKGPRLIEVML